jgi:very-short-patch-repair endonuclease
MVDEAVERRRGIVMGPQNAVKAEVARRLRRNMTRAETMLWHRLRANRLDGLAFRRQQVIRGFIADFYCHAVGVAIELDGSVHDGQIDYDAERTRILSELGIVVIRFPNSAVEQDIESVLTVISTECATRLNPQPGEDEPEQHPGQSPFSSHV